jgi:hypothetical protein
VRRAAVHAGGGPGAPLWSQVYGTDAIEGQLATSVVADGMGDVVVAGLASAGLDLGCGALSIDPDWNGLPSVDGSWSPSSASGAVATGAAGDVLLTGSFGGSIDFGCGALASVGSDVFLAELAQ